jgi:metallo-beta-lactamase class B
MGMKWLCTAVLMLGLPLAGQEDWDQPFPPHRIADNLYYVGSSGLSTYLVTTPQGHILINASFDRTLPLIKASVEKLGFKLTDVKILLSSHAHDDHVGGIRQLRDLTKAKVYVMKGDDQVIASGGKGQYLYTATWAPCPVDKVLQDGEEVTLGGITLRAHLTPGHTRGNTTWTMRASDRGNTYNVVIIGSPNVNSGYQLKNNASYPEIADHFARTFRVLKSLSCDIFLGAHGIYYNMEAKYKKLTPDGPNPFVDLAGYKEYVEEREQYYLYVLERGGV